MAAAIGRDGDVAVEVARPAFEVRGPLSTEAGWYRARRHFKGRGNKETFPGEKVALLWSLLLFWLASSRVPTDRDGSLAYFRVTGES